MRFSFGLPGPFRASVSRRGVTGSVRIFGVTVSQLFRWWRR